jgi:hypothetical protein
MPEFGFETVGARLVITRVFIQFYLQIFISYEIAFPL